MTSSGLRHHFGLAALTKTLAVSVSIMAWLLLGTGYGVAEAKGCFGTALVFAVDASGSVDDVEYVLQMGGLSHALRDPEVASAVQSAGGVALAAVIWSDTAVGTSIVGWQAVRNSQDIDRFARLIEGLPRSGGGSTEMGHGITQALDLLDDPGLCAMRRVIDVSGDGKETLYPRRRYGVPVLSARKRAEEAGVVINGLAIVDEEADLEEYYRSQVIAGAAAFVIVADSFADFATAMRAKLLREITPVNQAQLGRAGSDGERPN